MIFLLFLVSSVHETIADDHGLEKKIHEFIEKSVCVSDCIGSAELGEMTRHARNKGLHRELVTTVQLPVVSDDHDDHDSCGVMLIERLPKGMYIDTDEVANLARFGGPKLLHFDSMDVEKPAHVSNSHIILVYRNLSQDRHNKSLWSADFSIPIHLRYHPPNYGGIPPIVNLSSPLVLVSCLPGLGWKQKINYSDCRQVCKGGTKLEGPCWWNTSIGDCNWQLMLYRVSYTCINHNQSSSN
jgi:hypothetical protein